MNRPSFETDIEAIGRIDAIPTILDVVCRATGMGFAAVARVTEDRWVACKVLDNIDFGLQPGGELKVETTICHEIRATRKPVIIDHVAEDDEFCGHSTPAIYGFQSYISMPIVHKDGRFFGTLCAIDPRPARLKNPETIGMFKLFAELIASHLDSDEKLQVSGAALQQEQHLSQVREQFIAVLGHDLRNPLAAIATGIDLIGRTKLEDKALRLVPTIQAAAVRISNLINDVLDFARGRLGDGLTLTRVQCDLAPVLSQVVAELRTSHPDRIVETAFALDQPVNCDAARLSQLLSNLVANALTYGAPDKPVDVRALASQSEFELSVSNQGDPIPSLALEKLFEPFERGAVKPSQQGLGLGLYIASQIAAAHAGTLSAASTPEETRFTFRMPTEVEVDGCSALRARPRRR
jgi:signal transduction histidine kinase